MRTVRTIKTGLDHSRKKKVPCRTIQIEEKIRQTIAQEHGDLLSPEERNAIIRKEERRKSKHDRAINKARINILKKKEATALVQAVRRGENPVETDVVRTMPEKKRPPVRKGFHAIDLAY